MYRAPGMWLPPSVFTGPSSREGFGVEAAAHALATPASVTWPASNRAFYQPFTMTTTATAYRLYVLNGATVGTNSWDMGIYAADANSLPSTRLVSIGSTTSAGASVLQFFNITDTVLSPGLYFVGIAMNGTTDTIFRSAFGTSAAAQMTYYTQESAFALPDPATPVVAASFQLNVCGVAFRATV